MWHEPHGRYTIELPAGWKVESNPEAASLKISQGEDWAIFETSSNPGQSSDVAQQAAHQMQAMYQDWKVYNQGAFTTSHGHPAYGMTVGGTASTRSGPRAVALFFVAQGAGGNHYVTMTCSTAVAEGPAVGQLLVKAFDSIRFAGE